MIIDVNKQRVDSALVELYELEIEGSTLYYTNYPENVKFYKLDGNYTIVEYVSFPMSFSGYEQKSDGPYSRPTIAFANVLTTFKSAIGASNDVLIGKKLTRRKTLQKHLATGTVGQTFGTHGVTPVEQQKQVFFIDRIERESAIEVVFELTSGFDLQGITVPNRYILANTCTWLYQGAYDGLSQRIGACKWKNTNNNPGFTVYYDKNNRPIISGTVTTALSGSVTANYIYRSSNSVTKVSNGGAATRYLYYQALSTGTNDPSNLRQCRYLEGAWNSGTAYETYVEGKIYNPIVSYNNKLWVAIYPSTNVTPGTDSYYWERVDLCGKKLSSCAQRFKAVQFTGQSGPTNVPSYTSENKNIALPYGGFPGARRFNR